MKEQDVSGYEIHLGETEYLDEEGGYIRLHDGRMDGSVNELGNVIGTYLHHIFHNDQYRHQWLEDVRKHNGLPSQEPVDTTSIKEASYDGLAERVEQFFDMDYLMELISGE